MNEKIKWNLWSETPPTEKGHHWVYTKNRTGVHLIYRHESKFGNLNRTFEYWCKAEIPKPPRIKKSKD